MTRTLLARTHTWQMKEPFVISRGSQSTCDVVVVELRSGACVGRGEAVGVPYRGETPRDLIQQIEAVRQPLESGVSRVELQSLMKAGGARNAVDAALWDLDAKLTGERVHAMAGVPWNTPVVSAVTIGIRSLPDYEKAARFYCEYPWLKIKVSGSDPVAAVKAVRRGSPRARLIVDANQSWTIAQLKSFAPYMAELKVDLLEQPVHSRFDHELPEERGPVLICADESVETAADLPKLVGKYDFINIKLDKTGGLTAGLELAAAARAHGLRLMVGCMAGSSLAMAPGMVLAQICEIVDLDGPLLQSEDWPGGIIYDNGAMTPPWPAFWG